MSTHEAGSGKSLERRVQRGVPWAGLAALVSGYVLAFVVRYGTAVVLPGLRADFGADEAALGALAAAYFWSYALMQPVAGVLSDSWGPRRSVALWLAGGGLGTLLFAAAPAYPVALVGRALGGAGVGIVYICAIGAIGQWFGRKHFGTASGLYAATGTLGGLFAAGPLALVINALGWRITFGLIAVLLLATAAAAALTIPEPSRLPSSDDVAPGPRPVSAWAGAWSGLRQALGLRNVWLVGTYAFVDLGVLGSMQGLWTVPFLVDVYDLDATAAAWVLSAWSIGLLLGIPAWGYVADRVARTPKWTLFLSIVLHAVPWGILTIAPAAWPREALFILFLSAALTNGCWMPAYAQVRATSPPAIVGTAMGLLNFAFFAGAATYQQISGWILAQFPRDGERLPAEAYQVLFGLFVVSLAAAALAVAISRDAPAHRP